MMLRSKSFLPWNPTPPANLRHFTEPWIFMAMRATRILGRQKSELHIWKIIPITKVASNQLFIIHEWPFEMGVPQPDLLANLQSPWLLATY